MIYLGKVIACSTTGDVLQNVLPLLAKERESKCQCGGYIVISFTDL